MEFLDGGHDVVCIQGQYQKRRWVVVVVVEVADEEEKEVKRGIWRVTNLV